MKILVVGCGSIGKRHLRNLKTLGVEELVACDPQQPLRDAIAAEVGAVPCATYEEGLRQQPQAVFLCTPPSLHATQALLAAEQGCDLFIEKPLSHTRDGLDRLQAVAEERSLVTLIGCNMKFHPCIAMIKALLEKRRIGRPYSIRVESGQYLPDWRPQLDYRKNYGAHQAQGGGAILDIIHEIDYVRWLMGEVQEVACFAGTVGDLQIDTEDVAEIICRFQGGAIGELHLDYLSRRYTRSLHIMGSSGNILWDWHAGAIQLFADGKLETLTPAPFAINDMFVQELSHFLTCVRQRTPTLFPLHDARQVLEIALAAKEASAQRMVIQLRREVAA